MKRCAPWIMMILEKNVVKIRLLGSNTKFHMTHLQLATIETLNPISNHVDWMLQSLLYKHIIKMGLNWLWVIAYQRQLLVTKIFTSAMPRNAMLFWTWKVCLLVINFNIFFQHIQNSTFLNFEELMPLKKIFLDESNCQFWGSQIVLKNGNVPSMNSQGVVTIPNKESRCSLGNGRRFKNL
jgi:hypothetical protein